MSEVELYAQDLKDLMSDISELSKRIPSEWSLGQVMDSFLSIYDRFCPFEVGDRVELVKNIPVDESSGWYSCRHFLIQGAKATIRRRSYSDDKFTFDVEFDEETWIGQDGVERPVDRKHTFKISESYLRSSS